jgi:heme/copper-type cytochrome/quinol oxidase subunit 2
MRLIRSRMQANNAWTYTPYLYAQQQWLRAPNYYQILVQQPSLTLVQSCLAHTRYYVDGMSAICNPNLLFFSSYSGTTTYGRSKHYWSDWYQNYTTTITRLNEILTKREYLYRQAGSTWASFMSLPPLWTANPNHPIIRDIRATYLLQPTTIPLTSVPQLITWPELLQSYRLAPTTSIQPVASRNQYRPLKKGITNMIRLQATGAVAMPTEIRIQILASSKDVIHSWSIPSAGIKLDCVPGYSSHKIMIFLLTGIFWGQCMEICGRYHHWMPIVVFFMKRDLFFLWCLHFVLTDSTTNTVSAISGGDRLSMPVTFDKLSWLSELQ